MKYLVQYPKGYSADKKYPVILFLHGSGSRGDDTTVLEGNPFFSILGEYEDFPFILTAPLCPLKTTWYDLLDTLKRFSDYITGLDYVDKNRFYLVGNSMGGYGTWQLAMSRPELFAAIVPICGGGMYWNAGRLCNVPVWAFHGEDDANVLCEESVKMVDAVNKKGGNARLTVYPNTKHNCWTATYSNPEVFEWLLSDSLDKNQQNELKETYVGSKEFG